MATRGRPTAAATEESRTVRLAGGPLPYVLRRSGRARRLRVTVDPERGVVVTVPGRRGWAPPTAEVEMFLRDREGWLRRHLERHARQRATLAARGPLGDGSEVPYRGQPHVVGVAPAEPGRRRSSVIRVGDGGIDVLLVELARSDRRDLAGVLEGWLRDRARAAIDLEIARHAAALGVAPATVTVRDQRSRWGSASRKGRLSFSWRLVLAPPEALETVVVHELAHLRVFGHGPGFWALVASRRADHIVWRRWLRDHSWELHGALGRATPDPTEVADQAEPAAEPA